MRHRSGEVAAVAALIDSEEYEDAQSLAKAVIEQVYELFQERDWWGLQWGGRAYGPYADKASAKRASRAFDGLPTVHQLHSAAELGRLAEKVNPTTRSTHCTECGDPRFAHGFSNHAGCVVRGCKCKIISP